MVHPGHFPLHETRLRPVYIHHHISHVQHKTFITQLYFKGDPHLGCDLFVLQSLIITLHEQKVGEQSYEFGTFGIAMTKFTHRRRAEIVSYHEKAER